MTRLLLIRHGQSTWNALGRWQGQEDPPLTDIGRRQAWEASAAIGAVDAIFSSTLERAQVTAETISEQLGIGPVVFLPGLVERHAGAWQGLTRDEIEEQYPGFLDSGARPPGWESDEDLELRAIAALDQIVVALGEESPGVDVDVVVVTHGGLIYQIERRFGAPFERMANLGARWVEFRRGEWSLGDRVDLLGGVDVTIPDQI